MRRIMNSKTASSLWNPSLGIRFSPRTGASQTTQLHRMSLSRQTCSPLAGDSTNALAAAVENCHLASPSIREASSAQQTTQCIDGFAAIPCDLTSGAELGICSNADAIFDNSKVPETSLSFKMPSEKFRLARAAHPDSPASLWSHELYQSTTATNTVEKVKVIYCSDVTTMETTCRQHFLGEEILGVDLEWCWWASVDSDRRLGVSLIQMASPSVIALFHVAIFPGQDLIAPTFAQIMGDVNVSKAGVNISADCTRLKKWYDVETNGIFELSHLFKLVKYSALRTPARINRSVVPLAVQMEECFGLQLGKEDGVRRSNWSRRLNQMQIAYAASDAYAGLQLYHVLEHKRLQLRPCPRRPHHAELKLPILDSPTPTKRRTRAKPAEKSKLQIQEADKSVLQTQEAEAESGSPSWLSESAQLKARGGPDSQPESEFRSQSGSLLTATSEADAQPSSTRRVPSAQLIKNIRATLDLEPAPKPRIFPVTLAEMLTQRHCVSRRSTGDFRVCATPIMLRAYFLWYINKDLDPAAVAHMLRAPPLKVHTVIWYILESIRLDKMPFDRIRLNKEVLSFLHPLAKSSYKYGGLVRACLDH